jgi:3-hydroxyacyl-[acyl-carrier-protein] dehydratase
MIDPACTDERLPELDRQRIMEMIPHRPPFLMIDKVTGVVANEQATGIKNVSIDEYYFQGHFPARPVMPGVLIIEAMAQTAAVLVVHTVTKQRHRGNVWKFEGRAEVRGQLMAEAVFAAMIMDD